MDFEEKISRYEKLIAEVRQKAPDVRAARLCPATAHLSDRRKIACLTCGNLECLRFHEIGLDDDGEPLPEDKRPRCGAKVKSGSLCDKPVVPGKRRCRLHGGLSTGPKTEKGRAKIQEVQRQRWQRSP